MVDMWDWKLTQRVTKKGATVHCLLGRTQPKEEGGGERAERIQTSSIIAAGRDTVQVMQCNAASFQGCASKREPVQT